MSEIHHEVRVTATLSDNQASFQQLTDAYRSELLVHCYRILGSIEDAEDGLQETLLRAWRRFDTLKEQSALRAWLYKIATNVSLDLLDKRKSRSFPTLTHAPADPLDPLPTPSADPLWLDPLPETYLDEYNSTPEQHFQIVENITLAFLTALQHLPGRQRAILILCDVLDWKAQEAADALNVSVAAVNSSLQRARTTLKKYHDSQSNARHNDSDNPQIADLLVRYVQAWENADAVGLMKLLREDAALTMPPFPTWFRGRKAIRAFLDHFLFANRSAGSFRLLATRANGCPAFALYQRDAEGHYQLETLQILTLQYNQIVQIDDFIAVDKPLYERFNLPRPD